MGGAFRARSPAPRDPKPAPPPSRHTTQTKPHLYDTTGAALQQRTRRSQPPPPPDRRLRPSNRCSGCAARGAAAAAGGCAWHALSARAQGPRSSDARSAAVMRVLLICASPLAASERAPARARRACVCDASRGGAAGAAARCRRAHGGATPSLALRRREALSGLALSLAWLQLADVACVRAAEAEASASELSAAFAEAFAASAAGDAAAADAAWSRAVAAAPRNASALANRGTARLQAGRWADARDDLAAAAALETAQSGGAEPLTLNNLGNALGATGDWQAALRAYADAALAAKREPGVLAIARANTALALFQVGEERDALRVARGLLRRDPEFWDMRALTAALLWARGEEAAAEAEWATLCSSGRGFGAPTSAERPGEPSSGLAYSSRLLQQQFAQIGGVMAGRVRDSCDATPCRLYADVASSVAPRWPPRAAAALDAFLRLRRSGDARGYDGATRTYRFDAPHE